MFVDEAKNAAETTLKPQISRSDADPTSYIALALKCRSSELG